MRLRNIIIAVAVIGFGAVFRIGTSVPVCITELVYKPPVGGIIPKANSPANTVKRFFMLVDSGRYEEAYDLIIEPDWYPSKRPAPYREAVTASAGNYMGLVSGEEFVSRMTGEMGPKGIFLSLGHIKTDVVKSELFSLPNSGIADYPAYSEGDMVRVRGDYLASCAIYRWENILPVLKTSDGYKIVLKGTKNVKENYYLNWLNFSEKKLIKSLRGTPEKGTL